MTTRRERPPAEGMRKGERVCPLCHFTYNIHLVRCPECFADSYGQTIKAWQGKPW